MKRKILQNLELSEISHVRRGANPGARVVLWKSASTKEGVEHMSPEELQKKVETLETENATLTKRLATVVTTAKSAGVDVTFEGENVLVAKSAELEMVEFDGQMIAKSAIPPVVLAAIEKSRRETAELRAKMDADVVVKKAAETFPNLRGTAVEKAALLTAVESIADEAVRKSVTESLKAADAAVKKTFEEKGSDHVDESDPSVKLDVLVKTYAADKKVSYHAAYAEVTKSGEGKTLATMIQN